MNNCPFCHTADIAKYSNKKFKEYELNKCNQCEVIFASPFKSPSVDFYTEAQDISSSQRHQILFPFPKNHPARNFKSLKNGANKKILDIGCGNGSFLSFVSENEFECIGIDLDKKSISQAQKRNLKNTLFFNISLPEFIKNQDLIGTFDIITMFEVFEHLDNPEETIKLIKKLLKKDGIFIGSLPNIDRFYMWKYYMDYEIPPYHLSFWKIKSWKKYIEKHEFKMIFAENSNYYGYISDVIRLKHFYKNNMWSKVINAFLLFTKRFIESPIEKKMSKGAGFVFECKKEQL